MTRELLKKEAQKYAFMVEQDKKLPPIPHMEAIAADLIARMDNYIDELEGGWQDIAIAPKDGTEILLLIPLNWCVESKEPKEPRIGNGNYIKSGWWCVKTQTWEDRLAFGTRSATHWMPLPQSPQQV